MSRFILSATTAVILGLSGPATAATYNCLPVELLELDTRYHVQCGLPGQEGGYPKDGTNEIKFFAVQKSDVDFAKRFVHMMQTAITAGLVVQFQYKSGDTGGASSGCDPGNCRKPSAFGLLAPATDVRVP